MLFYLPLFLLVIIVNIISNITSGEIARVDL